MSVFTISPDLLENIQEDEKIYLTDILFVFTQRGVLHKVAKDKNGEILDIYRSIDNNADIIKQWLELMSYTPSKFENINTDLNQIKCIESKFIELCYSTKNIKQIIVYSLQNIKKFECANNTVNYKNDNITVFDRDGATNILTSKSTIISNNYINSQVAQNGSSINDSNN